MTILLLSKLYYLITLRTDGLELVDTVQLRLHVPLQLTRKHELVHPTHILGSGLFAGAFVTFESYLLIFCAPPVFILLYKLLYNLLHSNRFADCIYN